MSENNLVINIKGAELLELRPCDTPNPKFHRKTTQMRFDIEYDEAVSNYEGMWSTHKLYIRKDASWYEVWHYAFHRTNGREGSYSHRWEWKHSTSY